MDEASARSHLHLRLAGAYARWGDWLSEHQRSVPLALFLLALLLRLVYLVGFVDLNAAPAYGDGVGYDLQASYLLEGRGYVNIYDEPTAFRPPVYPLFLAAIYALTGHSFAAVRLVQALLESGTVVLVYLIALRLFNVRVAFLSAVGVAFYPLLIYQTGLLIAETLSYFLQMAAIFCLLVTLRQRHVWLALAAGVCMGLTVMTRPTATLWVPLMLLWILIPGLALHPWRKLATAIVGLALVFAPWVVRNFLVLDAFIPIASLGGTGLWLANNPLAEGGGVVPGPDTWPDADYPTRGYFGWEGLTEIESSQRFAAAGMEWIRNNPDDFLRLAPKKLIRLWSPLSSSVQEAQQAPSRLTVIVLIPYLIYLGLAAYGLFLARHKWRLLFSLLTIIIVANVTAIIYAGAARYAIPMAFGLIMFAAVAIDHILAPQKLGA